jgi:hypothetical protein
MDAVVALLPHGVKPEMVRTKKRRGTNVSLTGAGDEYWCSRRELNADTRIRNPLLYPFELREPHPCKIASVWTGYKPVARGDFYTASGRPR